MYTKNRNEIVEVLELTLKDKKSRIHQRTNILWLYGHLKVNKVM
jgi:hypothetical protein